MQDLKTKLQVALDILNSGDKEFIVETHVSKISIPVEGMHNYLNNEYVAIHRKPKWQLTNFLPPFRPLEDGEEWHRYDQWVESDLPEGYRPLLNGEAIQIGDEAKRPSLSMEWMPVAKTSHKAPLKVYFCRTKRPLPFSTVQLASELCDAYTADDTITWEELPKHVSRRWIEVAKKAKELLQPK